MRSLDNARSDTKVMIDQYKQRERELDIEFEAKLETIEQEWTKQGQILDDEANDQLRKVALKIGVTITNVEMPSNNLIKIGMDLENGEKYNCIVDRRGSNPSLNILVKMLEVLGKDECEELVMERLLVTFGRTTNRPEVFTIVDVESI